MSFRLDKLSSFFELVAAINFAFIISTHFIKSITERVCAQYIHIKSVLKSITDMHAENSKVLIDNSQTIDHRVLSGLDTKFKKINDKVEALEREVDSVSNEATESRNFNYLCLNGALYTIIMLLAIGFQFPFSEYPYDTAFFFFNIVSIFLLAYLFNTSKQFLPFLRSGYYQIVISNILLLLLAWGLGWFIRDIESLPLNYPLINKLIAVLVSSAHFVYYFFITIWNTKKTAKKYDGDLIVLKTDCENFASELNISIDIVNKLQTKPAPEK